jgi:transposase
MLSCPDEKTGIQATEHLKIEGMRPGRLERKGPGYIRNGALCLLAARDVKSGKTRSYSIGETRNEKDYLDHVKSIVATEPEATHVIVCDQLNTHKSASLVEWVAKQIGYAGNLGVKRRKGILGSMKSRMEFLEGTSHRIRFLFTPKHCSWMNQIEIWFPILQKRVINRGQFHSKADLANKMKEFIGYYDLCLAKPYKWGFEGGSFCRLFMK